MVCVPKLFIARWRISEPTSTSENISARDKPMEKSSQTSAHVILNSSALGIRYGKRITI